MRFRAYGRIGICVLVALVVLAMQLAMRSAPAGADVVDSNDYGLACNSSYLDFSDEDNGYPSVPYISGEFAIKFKCHFDPEALSPSVGPEALISATVFMGPDTTGGPSIDNGVSQVQYSEGDATLGTSMGGAEFECGSNTELSGAECGAISFNIVGNDDSPIFGVQPIDGGYVGPDGNLRVVYALLNFGGANTVAEYDCAAESMWLDSPSDPCTTTGHGRAVGTMKWGRAESEDDEASEPAWPSTYWPGGDTTHLEGEVDPAAVRCDFDGFEGSTGDWQAVLRMTVMNEAGDALDSAALWDVPWVEGNDDEVGNQVVVDLPSEIPTGGFDVVGRTRRTVNEGSTGRTTGWDPEAGEWYQVERPQEDPDPGWLASVIETVAGFANVPVFGQGGSKALTTFSDNDGIAWEGDQETFWMSEWTYCAMTLDPEGEPDGPPPVISSPIPPDGPGPTGDPEDPTDPDSRACGGRNFSWTNPATWIGAATCSVGNFLGGILRAILRAIGDILDDLGGILADLFVPTTPMSDRLDTLKASIDDSGVGQMTGMAGDVAGGVGAGFSSANDNSNCEGPAINFLPGFAEDAHPLSACAEPMATVAAWFQRAVVVGLLVLAIVTLYNIFAAPTGVQGMGGGGDTNGPS